MSKRVTLTEDDIKLIVKLLNDSDKRSGFAFVATTQRVNSILRKLERTPDGEAKV